MITRKILAEHVKVRPGVTSDPYVIAEVVSQYKELNLQGRRVLDLGGNIGAFAVYAALRGCSYCATYEPEQDNFDQLLLNTSPFPVIEAFRHAVVSEVPKSGEISFYLTTGNDAGGYSAVPFRGRIEVKVPAVSFEEVLRLAKPDVIKFDIEGGEYDLLEGIKKFPACVKEIIAEIHFNKKEFRGKEELFRERTVGWEEVKSPKQTGKNWHTLGHWRRK